LPPAQWPEGSGAGASRRVGLVRVLARFGTQGPGGKAGLSGPGVHLVCEGGSKMSMRMRGLGRAGQSANDPPLRRDHLIRFVSGVKSALHRPGRSAALFPFLVHRRPRRNIPSCLTVRPYFVGTGMPVARDLSGDRIRSPRCAPVHCGQPHASVRSGSARDRAGEISFRGRAG